MNANIEDNGRRALREAQERLKVLSAQQLVERIEATDYEGEPGPLVNNLHWQEVKRRLIEGS